MLAQIQKDFPQDVRVVFREFPLTSIHPNALMAIQAAEAANLQGKFWEMHDLLMGQQATWSGMSTDQFTSWLGDQVGSLQIDKTQFSTDLTSDAIKQKALAAEAEGTRVGVTYTPFLVIDGKIWQGPQDIQNLEAVVSLTLLEKRQFVGCPPMTIDPKKQYIATLQTEKGNIVIQLYADKAPIAVNSFIFLAKNGWFDGDIFHRVIAGYVAQAGDPSGTGYGGPGYAFKSEIDPSLKFDKAGVVGMANGGPDTNGSQFFITYAAQPSLDGNYTIFGQVVQGMDVAAQLTARDPSSTAALPPGSKLIKVTIEEK